MPVYPCMANRLPGSGEVTRLTLLSLLSAGPSHGYGLRAVMESWRMDAWANIRYGSIYQVLGRMAAEGLVKEVAHGREGRRPARSTYAITEEGREELHRLLRRAWATPSQEVQPVNVALSFLEMGLLPADEIEACLVERLGALEKDAGELEAGGAAQHRNVHGPGAGGGAEGPLRPFPPPARCRASVGRAGARAPASGCLHHQAAHRSDGRAGRAR